jgi:CRP-like cAMP-binding protein
MSDTATMQPFLDRLLDRSMLDEEERDAILSLKGRPAQARANLDIVSPGETTHHSCLVIDGIVGRFGQLVDGRRQITAFHLAGDRCDLHSIVFPKVGWSIQALTTTTLLELPHEELRRIARAYPAIAEAFWRDCVVDASILSQWVVNVGRRDARTRLAHILCEMAVRMEQTGLGSRAVFELHVTQSHLADALGLTSVHVNRVLQSLRREKLIATRAREVRILDWERLAALGDFHERYLETAQQRARPGCHVRERPDPVQSNRASMAALQIARTAGLTAEGQRHENSKPGEKL